MLIKAAVLHAYNEQFKIEEVELNDPGFNEVLIKVVSCGVCHTDEAIRSGYATPMPAVLGHEGSGIVEKVGPGVTGIEPGDHVALSYSSCGACQNCLTGKAYLCLNFMPLNFGGRMINGTSPLSQKGKPVSNCFGQSTFATHTVANIRNIVKVDKDVDLRLLGPLGCGVQTGAGMVINTFNPKAGSSIIIFGTGSVGLSALMAANASGCTKIIAVDILDSRLKMAVDLGATHTINSKKVTEVVAEVMKITGTGADYAFDTTGVPSVLQDATMSLNSGGIGGGVAISGPVTLDSWSFSFHGKSWYGGCEGDAVPQVFIPQMIDLYKSGRFPIDKMITFYDFEQINEAFEANHSGTAIKPVLVMPE